MITEVMLYLLVALGIPFLALIVAIYQGLLSENLKLQRINRKLRKRKRQTKQRKDDSRAALSGLPTVSTVQ